MPDRPLPLFVATGLVGLAGGYLASKVGWPLPWMVGSLLAIILVRCLTSWQLAEIPGGRKCGQWIVGIGIGLHFTPVVIEQVMSHFGLIFFGALVTSLSSVVGVWLMRRSGEDRATAFFSSMPGGSGEMVNLGARNGANLGRVAAGQSLRVLVVVLWISECVSPANSAVVLTGAAVLGLMGTSLTEGGKVMNSSAALTTMLSGFSSTAVLLVAAALFLAVALKHTGLDKRIALIVMSKIGVSPARLVLGAMIVGFVLALFIPSATARVGAVIPIMIGITAATIGLILLLLLVVYRSPIAAAIPLIRLVRWAMVARTSWSVAA